MKSIYKRQRKLLLRRGSGELPKYLFLFIASVGACLVWLVKSMDLGMLPTVAVPVSLIFLYCYLAWRTPWFFIREDQIGDNAYYLGFLFTLSSLAYALYKFALGQTAPEYIIASFGVALWSTIFGIIGRVFFSQMRQDPQDIEKESRARIAETASMLSGELNQAALTFNTYTRSLQQAIQEAFVQANDIAPTGLTTSIEKFSSTAEGMVQKIEGAFMQFSDQAEKLNDASSKTISALEMLNTRIERVETPDNLVNRKMDTMFSSLEKSTERLNTLADTQTVSVEALVQSSSHLAQGVKALNDQIAEMRQNTAVIGSGAGDVQKTMNIIQELHTALAHLTQGFAELSNKQAVAIRSMTEHADQLGHQLERSRKYTEETHESLASMTRTLAEKLQ